MANVLFTGLEIFQGSAKAAAGHFTRWYQTAASMARKEWRADGALGPEVYILRSDTPGNRSRTVTEFVQHQRG